MNTSRIQSRRFLGILAATLAVMAVLVVLAWARGPFWLGTNLDPDYAYLFNGLLIATGRPPEHVDHPGSTIQLLIAAVLRAVHPAAGREALITAVLDNPEFYLQATRGLLLGGMLGTLLAVGVATLRATGRTGAAVLVVLAPLLTPTVLREAVAVKPEPGVLMAGMGLGALALLAAAKGAGGKRAAAMGVVAALAVVTKITALPLLVLPLLVLRTWRLRGIYVGALVAAASVLLIPAYPRLGKIWHLTHAIATTQGRYGNPTWPAASPYGNQVALLERLSETPLLVVALVLTGVAAWRGRKSAVGSVGGASLGFCAALGLQVVLEGTHPYESRYLMPGLALVGPALVAAGAGLRPHMSAAWASRSAQQALAVAVGTVGAVTVWLTYTGFAEDRGALAAENELLARYPTSEVLDFYSASSPSFGLFFGNAVAGDLFGEELDRRDPTRVFFNLWQKGFASYRAVLSTQMALTSHDLILRGATPELWPPLKTNPMFQERLFPEQGRTLDGVYRVRVSPEIGLAFGDFVAEGLERAEAMGTNETVMARAVRGRAVLRFDGGDGKGRVLVGRALSGGLSGVTVRVVEGGKELGRVAVPAGGVVEVRVEVPGAKGVRTLGLEVEGGVVGFLELHVVNRE